MSPLIVSTTDQPTLDTKTKEVRVTTGPDVRTERQAVSATTAPSAPIYSRASVTGGGASTTTTHSTMTTPTSSIFAPVPPTFGRGRRRSSSEGVVQERSKTGPDVEELSRVKLLVAAKTQKVSQELVMLLESGSVGFWYGDSVD